MKYYITTLLDLKNILFGVFCLLSSILSAQLTTNSPYSGFGFGEIQAGTPSSYFGLGGVSAGWRDPFVINATNPASYTSIYATTFQVEGYGKINHLATASAAEQLNTSGLDNINFVFKKRNSADAFALGLRKYTSIGYRIKDSLYTPDFNVFYDYQGSGDVSVFNAGYAHVFKLKGFKGLFEKTVSLDSIDSKQLYVIRHRLSFGINAEWMFGILSQLNTARFDNISYATSVLQKHLQVNDFNFTLGFQGNFNLYHKGLLKSEKSKEKLDFNVGLSFTPAKNIQAKFSDIRYSQNGNIKDYVLTDVDKPGILKLPARIDVGAGFSFEKNEHTMQWGINYRQQDWSSFEILFDDVNISDPLSKATSLGTGFEITPQKLDKDVAYFSLMTYRVGARTSKTYWLVNNKNITENAITGGVSMPLLGSKSFSRFNFGMEIGVRGTKDEGLIQEKFTNFILGFTFTPHYYNRWFVKRKYD